MRIVLITIISVNLNFALAQYSNIDNAARQGKEQRFVNDMNGQGKFDMINKNVGKINEMLGEMAAMQARIDSLENRLNALEKSGGAKTSGED
jgi:hypothetical protein